MSIVIGLKYKDGVLLASDSRVIYRNYLDKKENGKVFKSKYSNTAIGGVGYARDLDIISCKEEWLSYKDILDKKKIDKKYVIENIVPNIFDILRDNHRVIQQNGFEFSESEFIFATAYNLYHICEDGSVIEFNDFATIGCGEDLVKGFMTNNLKKETSKLQFEEAILIIEKCIKEACAISLAINDDIVFVDLKVIGSNEQ